MDVFKVFLENHKAYKELKGSDAVIANQGGQGSSKTYSILQLLIYIALGSNVPLRITIASYALTHLRSGALRDFEQILAGEGVNVPSIRNKSESLYKLNKSTIEFVGIEGNEARVVGPRRDILYINEANRRISYNVFELMNARTSLATFIDFNPSAPFWFHDEIQPNFKHVLIKSTYLDNPKIPARELQNLLSKKNKPGYENWWKVYGLGELGQLEGAIYTNWKFGAFDDSLPFGYGLDFGVKDPDAFVKVAIDRKAKRVYLKEELYTTGLATNQLKDQLKVRLIKNCLLQQYTCLLYRSL